MFTQISERFSGIFQRLGGYGRLSEKNISDSLREVRQTLLEADVNYKVVREFIAGVREKSLGLETIKRVKPGQQIVKIIQDEMVRLLSSSAEPSKLEGKSPIPVMIVGLQGSGKTTFVAKYARYLKSKGKNPLAVACDLYRPAAVNQLETLCKSCGVNFYRGKTDQVIATAKEGISFAESNKNDVVIFDTAGRLHIDEPMMMELTDLHELLHPKQVLFVADGMTGQDAVNSAKTFAENLDFTGLVLTKMDGDARGGAALSIAKVTGKPIVFLSSGEKLDALEAFHADRMASRILGMGDIVSLVEKAQTTMDTEQAAKLEKKFKKATFDLNDLLEQMEQMRKIGSMDEILQMVPGGAKLMKKGFSPDEKDLVYFKAIIQSMTEKERRNPQIIDGSRRKRIASGSGTNLSKVNQVLKQFFQMQKMMKDFGKKKGNMRKFFAFPG
ncbi:MAG: signal recognition particle protein [Candidatus Marinimicrobia bacterium]|nr:signal recognition particle protein [Candidatus Neomarinimicrobiota bacterium]